ncbi:MAG: hypothetical protein HZB29_02215 [Nitrospinae bacterium]|nr:hypothetical protein [Nitrospinota bacterium]
MREHRLSLAGAVILLAPMALIYYFSTMPAHTFSADNEAALVISLKKVTQREHMCDEAELNAFREKAGQKQKHMRRPDTECGSRSRVSLGLKVWVDGAAVMSREIHPNGINRDMPVYVHEKLEVTAGKHTIKVEMRDSNRPAGEFDYTYGMVINIEPGGVAVLSFRGEDGGFVIL